MKLTNLKIGFLGLAVALIGCVADFDSHGKPVTTRGWHEYIAASNAESQRLVEAAQKQREAYAQAHPEYGNAVLNRQIAVGMSADDVTASLGKPHYVNKSVSAYGTNAQWVYDYCVVMGQSVYGSVYVYFDSGRVSSWQQTSL